MANALTNRRDVMVSMVIASMILMNMGVFVKLVTSLALIENVLSTLVFVMASETVQMAKTSIIVVSVVITIL
jgi:hypothetical protein